MTQRGRGVVVATLVALALILPGVASAHAYLVKTVPTPSANLNAPPPAVALTFDEAVEPRFAIISVTNAAGHQETTAPVSRSPANPDTLVVPLRPHLPEGWYLVYWRAISVDGHPVQGAYTFAIGPNAGPAAAVSGAVGRGDRDHAQAAGRALAALPDRDDLDRPLRAADRDRAAAAAAGRRDEPPGRVDRHGRVLGPRTARDSRLSRHRDLDRLVAVGVRGRDARSAVPRDGVRARLRRHGDLLRPVLRRLLDRRLGRPPAARAPVDRRAGGHLGRARRRSGRARVPRARRGTQARPRRAASRCCSTGCTSSPARSGSVGSSACCSSGRPCRG